MTSSGKSRLEADWAAVELLEFAVLRDVSQIRSKVGPPNFRKLISLQGDCQWDRTCPQEKASGTELAD